MVSTAQPLPPNLLIGEMVTSLWIAPHVDAAPLIKLGFRFGRSGVHQSKTMMLRELGALLQVAPDPGSEDIPDLILNQKVLQKRTGSSRRLALERLNGLYGLSSRAPIGRTLDVCGRGPKVTGHCSRYSARLLVNRRFDSSCGSKC